VAGVLSQVVGCQLVCKGNIAELFNVESLDDEEIHYVDDQVGSER